MQNNRKDVLEREISVLEWRINKLKAELESINTGKAFIAPTNVEEAFELFWKAYPPERRANKKGVLKKFRTLGLHCHIQRIVEDVKNRIENDRSWLTGFIPLAMTYINQERWDSGVDVMHSAQKLGCIMNKTDTPSADALMKKYGERAIKACVIEMTTHGRTPFLSHVAQTLSMSSGDENLESNGYFDQFWRIYPVKEGKAESISLWKTGNLDEVAKTIIENVRNRSKNDPRWIAGFAPNPANYIKGRRWSDEGNKTASQVNSDIINAILGMNKNPSTTHTKPSNITNPLHIGRV